MAFFDFLFPPRGDEAALRALSDDEFLALMRPRLVPETRPGTAALLPFSEGCVRSAIHEAKYHGSERAFSLLALALAEYLRDSDEGRLTSLRQELIIVPVPLGKARLKERGFNQVEEIARHAAAQLGGVRVESKLLIRTRETLSQVSLPRQEREENMRGAFSVHPAKLEERSGIELSNATLILLDDVITTGATLQATIDALRAAGAEHVLPLALAH